MSCMETLNFTRTTSNLQREPKLSAYVLNGKYSGIVSYRTICMQHIIIIYVVSIFDFDFTLSGT